MWFGPKLTCDAPWIFQKGECDSWIYDSVWKRDLPTKISDPWVFYLKPRAQEESFEVFFLVFPQLTVTHAWKWIRTPTPSLPLGYPLVKVPLIIVSVSCLFQSWCYPQKECRSEFWIFNKLCAKFSCKSKMMLLFFFSIVDAITAKS